jgi:hypothetical protein
MNNNDYSLFINSIEMDQLTENKFQKYLIRYWFLIKTNIKRIQVEI